MGQLPVYVSILALVVSVSSLILAALAYRRDRSNVRAWSNIVWQQMGPEPNETSPMMHVRIVNLGRRPVLVLDLVMKNGRLTWRRSLKEPDFGKKVIGVSDVVEMFHNKSAAHEVAVKLNEGEAFELVFREEDKYDFILTSVDPIVFAEQLFIEDVSGARSPVESSKGHLRVMRSARSGASSSMAIR